MDRPSHPTGIIGEMWKKAPLVTPAEPIPEIDPQWAQRALRDAESSFGEDGNWGAVPTDEAERSERKATHRPDRPAPHGRRSVQ